MALKRTDRIKAGTKVNPCVILIPKQYAPIPKKVACPRLMSPRERPGISKDTAIIPLMMSENIKMPKYPSLK
jgi:hypothetical protein